jgi:hypothetical protein
LGLLLVPHHYPLFNCRYKRQKHFRSFFSGHQFIIRFGRNRNLLGTMRKEDREEQGRGSVPAKSLRLLPGMAERLPFSW